MGTLHRPVTTSIDDGIATVGFAFPGYPANRLGLSELSEVVEACTAAAGRRDVEIVMLTGDAPAGFCPGPAAPMPDLPAARAAFSAAGQRLTDRLADLPAVILAVVAGPCRGPGFELALACDYRFAVARADSWIGFAGHMPAWGGSARVRPRLPELMTSREAVRFGVFDDAVCARLGRIELRQRRLDRLQQRPHKRRRRSKWFGPPHIAQLAAERRAFAARQSPDIPVVARWDVGRMFGAADPTPTAAVTATEVLMRGGRVKTAFPPGGWLTATLEAGQARGRWTPLEVEQAIRRVSQCSRAEVAAAGGPDPDTISAWRRDLGLPPAPPGESPVAYAPRRQVAAA